MREVDLRKLHRSVGAIVAVFILIQAGTGLYLSITHELETYGTFSTAMGGVHHGWGMAGTIFRIFTGAGTLFMAVTGLWIYQMIRVRTAKTPSKP